MLGCSSDAACVCASTTSFNCELKMIWVKCWHVSACVFQANPFFQSIFIQMGRNLQQVDKVRRRPALHSVEMLFLIITVIINSSVCFLFQQLNVKVYKFIIIKFKEYNWLKFVQKTNQTVKQRTPCIMFLFIAMFLISLFYIYDFGYILNIMFYYFTLLLFLFYLPVVFRRTV